MPVTGRGFRVYHVRTQCGEESIWSMPRDQSGLLVRNQVLEDPALLVTQGLRCGASGHGRPCPSYCDSPVWAVVPFLGVVGPPC